MSNGNRPAAPSGLIQKRRVNQNDPGSDFAVMSYSEPKNTGLTKREHFAGLAMQAYISGNQAWTDGVHGGSVSPTPGEVASEAVAFADFLLGELEATK